MATKPSYAPAPPATYAEMTIDASADRVWSVLSDPWSYAYWVVGSDSIRAADSSWPARGSEFKHIVGVWPLRSHDSSFVEEAEPPEHLRLLVKARPFVTARVWLEVAPIGEGQARIRMFEDAASSLSRVVLNPLSQPLVKARNHLALRRLRDLAEGRRPIPSPAEAKPE